MTRVDGLLMRRNADGSISLRVSEPGQDLTAATIDPEKLRFSSDWLSTAPIWYRSPVLRINKGATVTQAYPEALPYLPFASYMFRAPNSAHWRFSATSEIRTAFTTTAGVLRLLSQSSYAYVDVMFCIYRARAFDP